MLMFKLTCMYCKMHSKVLMQKCGEMSEKISSRLSIFGFTRQFMLSLKADKNLARENEKNDTGWISEFWLL